jgi:hypothetical protein
MGWVLVACCAGLVGVGIYMMWTIPPVDSMFLPSCTETCEHCGDRR